MGQTYFLTKKSDGFYLIIESSPSIPYNPTYEQLSTELIRRKIPFESSVLDVALKTPNSEEIKLSKNMDGINEETYLSLTVSSDKLKATLNVSPMINGTPFTQPEKILEFLNKQGIVHGIKMEILPEIISSQNQYHEWLIAEGTASVPGDDAQLTYNFNTKGIEIKPSELADGTVDFYNLNLIQTVESGTILVVKTPATPGENGMDVYGKELKAKPGKDVRLPIGQNTQPIEDNSKIIATKCGHVVLVNQKVNVLATYEVKGDVDFSTGNIQYNGNVVIHGNIKNSFQVEAEGDIEVNGNLEGLVISQSNIQVKKGIVRGNAQAKGNIFARHIENGTAECDGNIIITEAIMHSNVKAGKKVSVGGKKGLIVGGTCSAGEEITAKNIGAALGTMTVLEVGIRPKERDEYKEIITNMRSIQESYEKIKATVKTFQEMKQSGVVIPEAKNELFLKACRLQYQHNQQLEELSNRKIELEILFQEMEKAKICVEDTIYSGVTMHMGKSTYNVLEPMKRVMFWLDGLDIKHSGLPGGVQK